MVKGFSQVEEIDYSQIFTCMAKMDLVLLVLSLATFERYPIYYMDVMSSLLHGNLHKEIYMEQLVGFFQDPSLIFHLRKSLYGLKRSPQEWCEKIDELFDKIQTLIPYDFDAIHDV